MENNTAQISKCGCGCGLAPYTWEGQNYCQSCLRDFQAIEDLEQELKGVVKVAAVSWFTEKAKQGWHIWQIIGASEYASEEELEKVWDDLMPPDEERQLAA
jgi:hypothetical protein